MKNENCEILNFLAFCVDEIPDLKQTQFCYNGILMLHYLFIHLFIIENFFTNKQDISKLPCSKHIRTGLYSLQMTIENRKVNI